MIKVFTQTDLIRYLYHETTEEEKKEIDKALLRDDELKTLYAELRSVVKELDSSHAEPSSSTIHSILSYSRSPQGKQS
jgi:anti-sigma factor RsiW